MSLTKDIGKYIVHSNGEIFSKHSNKMLRKAINNKGYEYVALSQKVIKVHRVIATCFLQNKNNLPEVNHINGIKTDNRVENLEWCTHEYNVKHKVYSGLSSRGVKPISNTSGFVGVSYRVKARKFYAQIYIDGKYKYLGSFDTEIEAAKAYNEGSIMYHNGNGKLNNV